MTNVKILDTIFKAYDVRGIVGTELTEEVAEKIGRAMASWLPDAGAVAVGRDMRPDSLKLSQAIVKGLTEQGRDVWDIGEVTSDMIYFTTGHYDLAGGMMVTASHNPGDFNGIKFCGKKAKAIGIESGLLEIKELVKSDQWDKPSQPGIVTSKDVVEGWLQHALSFVDIGSLRPLKVVIDTGNGMAGKIIPELEQYVPFKVTEMYFELDGTFPNHIANPIEPENIQDIIARVKKEKADVGVAFDGDGDRAVLIDEKGNAISGTTMTAMLAEYFLKKSPKSTILYNATCGWVVPETIEKNGGKAIRTKVGHSFIKAEMRAQDALFAGESSGHYYFKDNFMADSGLIASLVALQVLSSSGKPLSELSKDYIRYNQIPETNFRVENKDVILKSLQEAFKDEKQDQLDGLTIWLNNAWVNVRPSNTESILRLNAEAKSLNALNEVVDKVTKLIKA